MYKYTCLLALTIAFAAMARAQSGPAVSPSTEDSVKSAVNALFTGMKDADAGEISHSFTDSAILQSITTNTEGKTIARSEDLARFNTMISKLGKGDADERIRIDLVRVDGPLAIVWAPYSFYYKGKFTHCGVDSFQLLRTAAGWKIQYIIDTRRTTSCELGGPATP
jgi:hypothetical protein